jgi:gliding motility-associated-like protein
LSNGCRDTVEKVIGVNLSPIADFTFNTICVNTSQSFTDLSSIDSGSLGGILQSWKWDFENNGSVDDSLQNTTHTYTSITAYDVSFSVTASNGCTNTIIKSFSVQPRPTANFDMAPNPVQAYETVSYNDQSIPAAAPITSWDWDFGNGTGTGQHPTNSYTDKGIVPVKLIVTDALGCKDTLKKDLMVTLLPLVPSAFTPNNDGANDLLFVKGGPFVHMSFRIYNNWGELIFVTEDQDTGWDGKYKGEPVPLGVYVFILDAELYNGKTVRKTGDITVLK